MDFKFRVVQPNGNLKWIHEKEDHLLNNRAELKINKVSDPT